MKITFHTAACLLPIIICGCSTAGNRPIAIPTNRISSRAVQLTGVRNYADKEGNLLVVGFVQKRVGCFPPMHEVLQIQALGANGEILAATLTRYTPSPLRDSRPGVQSGGMFEAHLVTNAHSVSKVQVAILNSTAKTK